jgi:hypothetical protein
MPSGDNMMGVQGFNAMQIILASGFPHVTELGDIPTEVARLASLPQLVPLVRADENWNFKLAANTSDPIRSDTTIYSGPVRAIPCHAIENEALATEANQYGQKYEVHGSLDGPAS